MEVSVNKGPNITDIQSANFLSRKQTILVEKNDVKPTWDPFYVLPLGGHFDLGP